MNAVRSTVTSPPISPLMMGRIFVSSNAIAHARASSHVACSDLLDFLRQIGICCNRDLRYEMNMLAQIIARDGVLPRLSLT